jgi:hypothetical protein
MKSILLLITCVYINFMPWFFKKNKSCTISKPVVTASQEVPFSIFISFN